MYKFLVEANIIFDGSIVANGSFYYEFDFDRLSDGHIYAIKVDIASKVQNGLDNNNNNRIVISIKNVQFVLIYLCG
jgi:hypothetical protein